MNHHRANGGNTQALTVSKNEMRDHSHAGTNGTDINICGRQCLSADLTENHYIRRYRYFHQGSVWRGCKRHLTAKRLVMTCTRWTRIQRIHLLQSNSEWRRCRYFGRKLPIGHGGPIEWRPPVMDAREKIDSLNKTPGGHFSDRPVHQPVTSSETKLLKIPARLIRHRTETNTFDVSSSSMQIRPRVCSDRHSDDMCRDLIRLAAMTGSSCGPLADIRRTYLSYFQSFVMESCCRPSVAHRVMNLNGQTFFRATISQLSGRTVRRDGFLR